MTDQAPAVSPPDETPVEDLPPRPGVRNALLAVGVRTLGDLRAVPDRELLRLRHFGPRALADVRSLVPAPGAGDPG